MTRIVQRWPVWSRSLDRFSIISLPLVPYLWKIPLHRRHRGRNRALKRNRVGHLNKFEVKRKEKSHSSPHFLNRLADVRKELSIVLQVCTLLMSGYVYNIRYACSFLPHNVKFSKSFFIFFFLHIADTKKREKEPSVVCCNAPASDESTTIWADESASLLEYKQRPKGFPLTRRAHISVLLYTCASQNVGNLPAGKNREKNRIYLI